MKRKRNRGKACKQEYWLISLLLRSNVYQFLVSFYFVKYFIVPLTRCQLSFFYFFKSFLFYFHLFLSSFYFYWLITRALLIEKTTAVIFFRFKLLVICAKSIIWEVISAQLFSKLSIYYLVEIRFCYCHKKQADNLCLS